ncbi:MAG: PilN domain-containing protein [Thermodesulfobacteriota bacterium]
MIRINLLPIRAARKKEFIRFQMTIAALATIFVISISLAYFFTVRSEARMLRDDIVRGEEELKQLRRKVGELSRIKQQKQVVEEKLRVINGLEAQRTGPTTVFRIVSNAIPKKAWLTAFKDQGSVVTLTGYAFNDETVAEYMRRLQKSLKIGAVELDVVQRIVEGETGSDVVKFVINLEK